MARIVLVTGSRDHDFPDMARSRLRRDLALLKPDLVITGGARGTDTWAVEWCHDNAVQVEIHRPTQDELNKRGRFAFLDRNTRMLNVLATYDPTFHSTVVLAQPNEPCSRRGGTWDTIAKAMDDEMDVLISY